MDNKDIIKVIKLAASIMELHNENPFKIRQYQSLVFKLEKANNSLSLLSEEEIAATEGIGKNMAAKIKAISETGSFPELSTLLEETPKGLLDIMNLKGLGPKKIRVLWQELNITNTEELRKACEESQVAKLKGFGAKTQDTIKQGLAFLEQQKDKFLYAEVEELAYSLEKLIKESPYAENACLAGDIRRKMEIVHNLQILVACTEFQAMHSFLDSLEGIKKDVAASAPFAWRGKHESGLNIEVKMYPPAEFGGRLYIHSASKEHLIQEVSPGKNFISIVNEHKFKTESDLLAHLELPNIDPEYREGFDEISLCKEGKAPCLVTYEDLKGILHNHTTYSDGVHSLEEMAAYCKNLGFEYLGISDHSKTAYYAGGLTEEDILKQHAEIDELNKKLTPFKIFKGIESDILNDGALDYEDSVLASFDFIVASVHANLKMTEEKATQRLITAIENPYTTILGHATGRLLLRREGYPIDHKKVIDACAANNVVIEINANPRRLDMDWRWIRYAISKNVMISINPDAHKTEGYHDMKYGVYMGRKAGLTKEMTFNALSLSEIEKFFAQRKKAVGV
ncbi:DNA polymerase/3'-5' exonuclease PolX [Cytophagaceae bacterium ABcell3]|nr:DNA polymerase/3'-5' exonuclease PolX [Cytophagaceae bacterium ABcell3]